MNTEIRYTGYCNLSDLPVREGDESTLPKGTPYTYRGELRETGRKTRVKVNHVLEGSDLVVGYYQRTSGHYHLGCASEADMHLVRKLYGTDNLEELWPRMRVSGDIHATIPRCAGPGRAATGPRSTSTSSPRPRSDRGSALRPATRLPVVGLAEDGP